MATDYSRFGEPAAEWLDIQATLPPSVSFRSPEAALAIRETVNKGREDAAALAMQALGPKVTTQDYTVFTRDGRDLSVRSYKPNTGSSSTLPVYIHLHGGGFLFGTLSSEDATCSRTALDANVLVINVCYSHTPEHPYPTAWNDIEDALAWLDHHVDEIQGDPKQVILGGISAGAWLTASTLIQPPKLSNLTIVGQVLMIPCVVHPDCYAPRLQGYENLEVSSYEQNKLAPVLPLERAKDFSSLLAVQTPNVDDIRLNPGNASPDHMKRLPPTVFGVAGLDILRDEGLQYAEALHACGVPTHVSVFPGVPHGFRRFGDKLSECRRWDSVIVNGVKWILDVPSLPDSFRIYSE